MNRKEFIKNCGALCLGGMGVALLHSCKGNYYTSAIYRENAFVISKKEFVEVKDGKEKSRKYILLRSEKTPFPICIFKLNESTYSALLMECSHKSCELNPHGDYLICPCHGSEFNNLGVVQNPPAETDLISYKVNQDNENIYITI